MKAEAVLLSKKTLYICIGIAVILMILGSFVDYPLSCALYNETNPIAVFFAAYGELPAILGWVAAGSLLAAGHSKKNKILGMFQCIGGIVLIAAGGMSICFLPSRYLTLPPAILTLIGLALSTGTVVAVLFLAKGADRRLLIQVAAAVFFTVLLEMVLVNCIKVPWGRARMRLVAENPQACFMPWWQIGGELKNTMIAAGTAAEEFKSFPSGHTANAATMLLLGLIPLLQPKRKKYKNWLLAFGFTWAAVVAFTRIIMGAHYLTDTVVGFTISILCIYLVCEKKKFLDRNTPAI